MTIQDEAKAAAQKAEDTLKADSKLPGFIPGLIVGALSGAIAVLVWHFMTKL